MYLSDRDIIQRLEQGDLVIEPLDDPELQIQPASVDLRLGDSFRRWIEYPNHPFDTARPNLDHETSHTFLGRKDQAFTLQPGEFVLATTIERVELPNDLLARVEGRSSIGRLGITVHVTAGFIDPGFRGRITLEMANLNHSPVKLYAGMRICQLSICQLSSPCLRPYGRRPGSKYQDQDDVVASRIGVDFTQ